MRSCEGGFLLQGKKEDASLQGWFKWKDMGVGQLLKLTLVCHCPRKVQTNCTAALPEPAHCGCDCRKEAASASVGAFPTSLVW